VAEQREEENAAEEGFPIEVEIGPAGETRKLATRNDVERWVDEQRVLLKGVQADGEPQRLIEELNRQLGRIAARTTSVKDVGKQIVEYAHRTITSDSSEGRVLARLKQEQPKAAAWFLYALAANPENLRNIGSSFDSFTGIAAAAAFKAIGDPLGAREGIEETLIAAKRDRADADEAKSRFEALKQRMDREWDEKLSGFEAKVALGSPRKFWTERAEKHETAARLARSSWRMSVAGTLMFLVIAFFALVSGTAEHFARWALWWGKPPEPPASGSPAEIAGLVQRGVFFVMILGFAVWWLRDKLRTVLSHEHLAEDARERVTMIETYAAMKGVGLEAGDLGPILAALYRSASTGNIKDDSGPVTPIEIVSKAVERVATGGKKKDD
jgi:hypothetical protein